MAAKGEPSVIRSPGFDLDGGSVLHSPGFDLDPESLPALRAALAGIYSNPGKWVSTGETFSAGDLRLLTGLSYRQLNDWEGRGALPVAAGRGNGWRRFTERELFVVLVAAEFRRRLGTPLERLAEVQRFMLREEANHFEDAAQMVSILGVGVWFVTDFEDTFALVSDLEFADMWADGLFGQGPEALSMVKLNPLVNRVLGARSEPVALPEHGAGLRLLKETQKRDSVWTDPEKKLIDTIRSGDFDKVEIKLKSGSISHFTSKAKRTATNDIRRLLADHEYQSILVTQVCGKVVSVEQAVTTKVTQ